MEKLFQTLMIRPIDFILNKMTNQSPILEHDRLILPVGQGGFAFEHIGDTSVIFDCGSLSSQPQMNMYIDALVAHGIKIINYLFISHFDRDHVNGIRYLLASGIHVQRAVMSYIPKDFRAVYNVVTGGAYDEMLSVLREGDCAIDPIGAENEAHRFHEKDLWEWIARSMMQPGDFSDLEKALLAKRLDKDRLKDADYLKDHTAEVNNAFKKAFGKRMGNSNATNAMGLIMLSQKTRQAELIDTRISRFGVKERTGCLYVGDSNISTQKKVDITNTFIHQYISEYYLLLMQLPHHGSRSNIHPTLHKQIAAEIFYVNDLNCLRIIQSPSLFFDLKSSGRLALVGENEKDILWGRSLVR